MRKTEASVDISLSREDVLDVFIKQEHLRKWWGVRRSLIELKKGGLYSLVWQSNDQYVDYVSAGVIAEYLPACQLKIDKMFYVNPQRSVLGPMELLILATPEDNNITRLTVIQSGYKHGADWDWLYEAVRKAWPEMLGKIKSYLEDEYVEM